MSFNIYPSTEIDAQIYKTFLHPLDSYLNGRSAILIPGYRLLIVNYQLNALGLIQIINDST